jgi:hypothetical protein
VKAISLSEAGTLRLRNGGESMTTDQEIEMLKQTLRDLAAEIHIISCQLATLAESLMRSQENA